MPWKIGMGACQGNLIQFSKQKKTRVIAGKQKCRPGLGKSHVMSECKKKTLGVEELIFFFICLLDLEVSCFG